MTTFLTRLYLAARNAVEREEGQSLVEYGLIIALIAVVCLTALTALGTNAASQLQTIANKL